MAKQLKIGRLATIAPVYYLCKMFGIIPVSYSYCRMENNRNPKDFCGRSHNNIRDVRFHVSKSGIIFWILHVAIQVWTFFGMSKIVINSIANKKKIVCSADKYCTKLGTWISHSILILLIIILVGFRPNKSVRCFNMVAALILRCRYIRGLSFATFAVLVSTAFIVIRKGVTIFLYNGHYPTVYYGFFVSSMCTPLIIHLVSIICLVSQNSYEDINREMGELCSLTSKPERAMRLTSLMNDHWYLEDFIDHISKTFGPELLFVMIDTYTQLLLCSYMFVWENIVRRRHVDTYSLFNLSLYICIVAGNLIYLCYRCNATVKESRRIISQIQHLRNVLRDDPICEAILNVFTHRVNSREVNVTALKLFDINLPLLCGSAGLMFTYFLVLVQFQIDGYKKSQEFNISKTIE